MTRAIFKPIIIACAFGSQMAYGSHNTPFIPHFRNWQIWKVDKGHTDPVSSISWSPDGSRLASSAEDSTRLLNINNNQDESSQVLVSHHGARSCAWSPDGKLLAVGTKSGRIDIIKISGVTREHTLEAHSAGVSSLCWSPDGSRLISSCSDDNTVAVWDAKSFSDKEVLKGHGKPVHAVALNPAGKLLASAGSDGVRVWDIDSKQSLYTVHVKGNRPAIGIAWSPSGETISTLSSDGEVELWDMRAQPLVRASARLPKQEVKTHNLSFHPSGQALAVPCADGVHVLAVPTDRGAVETLAVLRDGPMAGGARSSAAFSPDGGRLACAGRDCRVLLWAAKE